MTARKKAKKKPPQLKLRALDENAFRVFARKAGPMKHRRDKRRAQRDRRNLLLDLPPNI